METLKVIEKTRENGTYVYLGATFSATYDEVKDLEEGVTRLVAIKGVGVFKNFEVIDVIPSVDDYIVLIEINLENEETI
jgi:hypothetical protein